MSMRQALLPSSTLDLIGPLSTCWVIWQKEFRTQIWFTIFWAKTWALANGGEAGTYLSMVHIQDIVDNPISTFVRCLACPMFRFGSYLLLVKARGHCFWHLIFHMFLFESVFLLLDSKIFAGKIFNYLQLNLPFCCSITTRGCRHAGAVVGSGTSRANLHPGAVLSAGWPSLVVGFTIHHRWCCFLACWSTIFKKRWWKWHEMTLKRRSYKDS